MVKQSDNLLVPSPQKDEDLLSGGGVGVYTGDAAEKKSGEDDMANKTDKKRPKILICGAICAIVAGILLIILGVLAAAWFSNYVNSGLKSLNVVDTEKKLKNVLNPTSQENYVPKYRTVYLFRIKNPIGIREGEVPQVEEVGPYNFEVIDRSDSYSISEDGLTYYYKTYAEFKFTAEGSCKTCADPKMEVLTAWNPAYLRVMAAAGGEQAFANQVLAGLNVSDLDGLYDSLQLSALLGRGDFINIAQAFAVGSINCLDSFNGTAIAICVDNMQKLLSGLTGGGNISPTDLLPVVSSDAVKGAFPGLFVARSVEELVLGHPSFVAGLGVASSYDKDFSQTGSTPSGCGVNSKYDMPLWKQYCQVQIIDQVLETTTYTCAGSNRSELADLGICRQYCTGCFNAAMVVAYTENRFCPYFEKKLLESLSQEEAKKIVEATCGRCTESRTKDGSFFPYCLAPIPGALASFDLATFTEKELAAYKEMLPTTMHYTGQSSTYDKVQDYIAYNGQKSVALWANSVPNRSNPRYSDYNAAGELGDCGNPSANITCVPVTGNPGTAMSALGSGATGLKRSAPYSSTFKVYLSQANIPVMLYNTDDENTEVEGIKLFRYRPSTNLLVQDEDNIKLGFGFPVDGVQNLFFTSGFLAYLSAPFFYRGNDSLLKDIELSTTRYNGAERVTPATFAQNPEFAESLDTTVDVEPSTGSTMQAHKRIQANFAVGQGEMTLPYFDLTNRTYSLNKTRAEVIIPAYWVDENAAITKTAAGSFKLASGLASATLPVAIASLVLGPILLVAGVILLRRAKLKASANVNSSKGA